MNLGERLRSLRRKNNLSQNDLAKKLNCTKSSISMYENNHRRPSIEKLIELAKIYSIDMNTLLLWQEENSLSSEIPKNLVEELGEITKK